MPFPDLPFELWMLICKEYLPFSTVLTLMHADPTHFHSFLSPRGLRINWFPEAEHTLHLTKFFPYNELDEWVATDVLKRRMIEWSRAGFVAVAIGFDAFHLYHRLFDDDAQKQLTLEIRDVYFLRCINYAQELRVMLHDEKQNILDFFEDRANEIMKEVPRIGARVRLNCRIFFRGKRNREQSCYAIDVDKATITIDAMRPLLTLPFVFSLVIRTNILPDEIIHMIRQCKYIREILVELEVSAMEQNVKAVVEAIRENKNILSGNVTRKGVTINVR